jgi:hypothetical protein
MKIGFSFGRGVRDIVQGKVHIDDVLCIIARTHMPSVAAVKAVIQAYMYEPGYLMDLDPDVCQAVGMELFVSGKILEPRANGISVMKVPREYVWMDLYPTSVDSDNTGIQSAWESYRMLIELGTQVPDTDNEVLYRHSPKLNIDEHGQEVPR